MLAVSLSNTTNRWATPHVLRMLWVLARWPGRSGYGNDPAYSDPAYSGSGPDWTPDDSDADWPGSDESLEPLPSTQTHRGGGGPDDRSRRRWPAPDGDDGDGRNGW